MSGYLNVAQIKRAKGLTGEVVAVSAFDLPLRFWEKVIADGVRCYLVPPRHDLPREQRVLSAVAEGKDGAWTLKLSDIGDRDLAQRALGSYLLVTAEPGLEVDEARSHTDVGMQVIDTQHGCIGSIVEERVGTAQNIWVLEGRFGEVLIPAVEEFIVGRSAEHIEVELPQGLLELNH